MKKTYKIKGMANAERKFQELANQGYNVTITMRADKNGCYTVKIK